MSHPLVLGLYANPSAAVAGARAVHAMGIARDRISVVSRSHQEEGALAEVMGATPGADIEDSRPAGLLGEMSGYVLAAMAIVMPGIGPIVAAGPLAAGLGEAAGHVAGGVASVLTDAGVTRSDADAIQRDVENGAVLVGIHCTSAEAPRVRDALETSGANRLVVALWKDS